VTRAPSQPLPREVETLDDRCDLWRQCFTVAPLVLIGTREESGELDFAPKHMATPLGWDRYFGFVCTPRHSTYRNVRARGAFTVTFPRPEQLLLTSLAAAPRDVDDVKHSLRALPTFPATAIDGAFVASGYLFLECELDRIVDGFGDASLIAGRVVQAHIHRGLRRDADGDDQELVSRFPLLVYLHPDRFATVSRSYSFPYPAGFRR